MTKDGTDVVEPWGEASSTNSETNIPPEVKPALALGDRVRMSALGRARHPRYGDRQGLLVGRGSPSSWRIKFDERKCVQAIHQAYLERVVRSGARSPRQFDVDEISECMTNLT